MPSLFLAAKQSTYRAQRTASQGASITLVCGVGEYAASFDCVARITPILGTRGAAASEVPTYAIPFEDAQSAITKLTEKYSVALVDSVCDADSSRFVLIWKIPQAAKAAFEAAISTDLLPHLKDMVSAFQSLWAIHAKGLPNETLDAAILAIAKASESEVIPPTPLDMQASARFSRSGEKCEIYDLGVDTVDESISQQISQKAEKIAAISETTEPTKQTFDPDEY